jgi:Peptidase inhibitor I66
MRRMTPRNTMGIVSGTFTLYAAQTPLGVLDSKLFAFLVPPIRAHEWTITPVPQHGENAVIIQAVDDADGLLLPADDPGTQVAVRPLIAGRSEPPTYPPDEVWVVTPLAEPDAPDLVPDAVAFTLRPQSVSDDQFIGRNEIEDLSMRPKPIVLRRPHAEPTPFIAIPVTEVGENPRPK